MAGILERNLANKNPDWIGDSAVVYRRLEDNLSTACCCRIRVWKGALNSLIDQGAGLTDVIHRQSLAHAVTMTWKGQLEVGGRRRRHNAPASHAKFALALPLHHLENWSASPHISSIEIIRLYSYLQLSFQRTLNRANWSQITMADCLPFPIICFQCGTWVTCAKVIKKLPHDW